MAFLRGLEQKHEQDPHLLLRDTRTFGQKMVDALTDPTYVAAALVLLGITALLVPAIADIILFVGAGVFIYTFTRKVHLPFRLPMTAKSLDYNDIKPSSTKPNMARGICFLGNEMGTNQELWFSNEDMRTHLLIFGSTGAGKTEAMVSFAYNALIQGSGFIYVDGKGDNSLYAKVFSMARRMGREDDLLLVNYMTGARDIVGPQEKRLSNTLNPFATGSSSMLSQLVVSLMDSSSASPDGDMWKGRAISFVEALMKPLVYMRDKGHILLDANVIRNYFHLPRLEAMVIDKRFELDGGHAPVNLEDVPEEVMQPVNNYLLTLPGYNKEKKGKQVSQVLEQHGFITMQLTRVFTSLADTYGHIMRTELAEVDLRDVVLNRRILVVLLPALEKSPDELSNLGKIIVATLKAMMASGLGSDVEGEYRDIIQRKPTNAKTPFMCILDEYGYYSVEGFSVVPAQARSLGFSAIFAGQDLPAFQKASKEEAASIGANTNIKIAMKLEDPTETWEFFMKTAGEALVTKVDHFQTSESSVFNNYADTRSSSFEKRARVDLLDLKDQGMGEATIFFKSRIVRARTFFANPPPVKRMRLNQFLKVNSPEKKQLIQFERRLLSFRNAAEQRDLYQEGNLDSPEVRQIVETLAENEHMNPIERGVLVLLSFQGEARPAVAEEDDSLPASEMNIFTGMRHNDELSRIAIVKDMDSFGQPMLGRASCGERIEYLERLSGKTDKHAQNIATEVIKDMLMATHYPPTIKHMPSGMQTAGVIYELVHMIRGKKKEQADKGAKK